MTSRQISKDEVKIVGLIGIGTMGRGILEHVIKAGYPAIVSDPAPQSQEFAITAMGWVQIPS